MDKSKYYIIGIFLIVVLSIVYILQMSNKANEKIETDLNISYEKVAMNYTDRSNQTPIEKKIRLNQTKIKLLGKIHTGEEPIMTNSDANWYVNVIFDNNTTEKMAEEIISKYYVLIPEPREIKRSLSDPRYYLIASMSDLESIKNRLEEEEYSNPQLAKKPKIKGENFTAAVWGVYNEIPPGLRSSGIQFRETMVMELVYGPETPQTESKNIMELLDGDDKIIGTTTNIYFKCNCYSEVRK